jgi:hypothetical protein
MQSDFTISIPYLRANFKPYDENAAVSAVSALIRAAADRD